MKKTLWLVAAGAAATLVGMQALVWAQAGDEAAKPKHTIKEVMEQAHKGGLMKKVAEGEASDEEQAQLLDLYVSLTENEPPRGHRDSFHKMAADAVVAAARVVVGRDGAEAQLAKAVNCMACHKEHKPPTE